MDNEPKYTPFLGSKDTKVMAIGEAPSTANKYGAFCGGKFSDIELNLGEESLRKSHVDWVKRFVLEEFNCIPHFTDLAKCGIINQKKDKKKLSRRFHHCIDKFLISEIEILKPEIVLCIGGLPIYNENKYKSILHNMCPTTTIIRKIMHYSKQNQGRHHNCYYCIKEIWKEQIVNESLTAKHFNRKICTHK